MIMHEEVMREQIAAEILDMEFPVIQQHSRNVKHDINSIIFEIAMRVREGVSDSPEKIRVPTG
jgi:hypothetical protein